MVAIAPRRAAATAVSTEMGLQEREAVAAMVSHSIATQQRYYDQTKGREKAVRGVSGDGGVEGGKGCRWP